MARNKDSRIMADGLFDEGREDKKEDTVIEVKEDDKGETVVEDSIDDEMDTEPAKNNKKTSSKKGNSAKKTRRLNLTLTEENYKFIKMQSIKEDTTATEIVNRLIQEYKLKNTKKKK